jgi:molybdopterin-guanine dinucleotide biosynthesis protein A
MTSNNLVTIAVVAGGQSQRMGQDKAFLQFGNKPLLEHILNRLATLNLPMILIVNQPEKYTAYNLPVYKDIIPGHGSLGGLYTAIASSQTTYTLCVAVDMPFLNSDLLTYLVGLREGYDGVVPMVKGYPEPLHAVYRKSCLAAIHSKIEANQLKISGFYDGLHIRYVEDGEMRAIDPELRSFTNINTPDEWQAAQESLPQ